MHSEEAADVRVELAVCKLLLGRRQEAEAELCLSADAPQPPDPAVQEFILVRPSPNPQFHNKSGSSISETN